MVLFAAQSKSWTILLSVSTLFAGFIVTAVASDPESCGVVGLFDYCVLVGRELSKEQRQEIVAAYPAEEASMLDVKQAAEALGPVFPEMQM